MLLLPLLLPQVLEAVLPVRQQQARWAKSKAATEGRNPPPADPVLANLLDLAASGPSSCATSPSPSPYPSTSRAGAGAGNAAAAAAGDGGRCAAEEVGAPSASRAANMAADSPAATPAPGDTAPCGSSCGATTAATSSGTSTNPSARDACGLVGVGHCHHRSRHHHNHEHHPHNHGHGHEHGHGNAHRACSGGARHHGDAGCKGYTGCCCTSPHHAASQARWLDAWRRWVREAALLLQTYDARPSEHYLNRLEEAFTKLKSEVVYLGLRHPELICNMRWVNLETGAEQEFPPDSFWSLVVAGMKLTEQQVRT